MTLRLVRPPLMVEPQAKSTLKGVRSSRSYQPWRARMRNPS